MHSYFVSRPGVCLKLALLHFPLKKVFGLSKKLNSRKTDLSEKSHFIQANKKKKMDNHVSNAQMALNKSNCIGKLNQNQNDYFLVNNEQETNTVILIENENQTENVNNNEITTDDLLQRFHNASFEENNEFLSEDKKYFLKNFKNNVIVIITCRIFDGSFLSEKAACLMILSYFDRFDLSIVAQEKLLELIRILLPSPNNLPKTLNKLKKTLKNEDDELSEKLFCDNCMEELSDTKICQNINCSNRGTLSKTINTFTYLNLRPRLTRLIKNYVDDIESYKIKRSNFKDLIDSDHYKYLNISNQLTLMVYSDGISVSKSGSQNFWPVIVSLCELPITLRDSIKNKIVCGVWLGKKKPSSDILFTSLIEELRFINQTGICIQKNSKRTLTHFH